MNDYIGFTRSGPSVKKETNSLVLPESEIYEAGFIKVEQRFGFKLVSLSPIIIIVKANHTVEENGTIK